MAHIVVLDATNVDLGHRVVSAMGGDIMNDTAQATVRSIPPAELARAESTATREVMAKGSFLIRPGTVHLHFLEAIPTRGLTYDDRTELMERVWSRMADEMRTRYGVQTAEHAVAPEGERKE